jgi:hypothetical protein
MTMHADAHFAIGKTHKVCEDYALAGQANDHAFAIVSDGCSSSPDTDFGSRLMARAARSGLMRFGDRFDPERAAWVAQGWQESLGLVPNALDATLLVAFETSHKTIRIVVVGDGVVAGRRRDTGLIDYWAVRYPAGAPGYLTYLLNPEREKLFLEHTDGIRQVDVSWGHTDTGITAETRWDEVGPVWTLDRDPAVYDLIAVMSDGAESFQRFAGTRLENIPVREVLDQVMTVKGSTGEFMRRRVGKFLSKFCVQNGWQHYDDFAVAALFIDPPEVSDG